MNQSEDREEGVPPSKSTLCGEHDSQTKAQSPQQTLRPDSAGPGPGPGPEPSCVSFKSDRSSDRLINFKQRHSSDKKIHQRPDSAGPGPGPGPSCVSFKSDGSIGRFIDFKDVGPSAAQRSAVNNIKI
ncbi:uncharacterized protein LOC109137546 isoform X2 [Larimichthys crocea]|uniref:uncharacterized protein LOC109137546 isoform X2 n=1 Tax=Larimichthys crocea TaxID=215358 RepID=UPI000F5F6A99|nr:uncharacterized protein LOC109137546 isoform X2 [Larimichthys crocea]